MTYDEPDLGKVKPEDFSEDKDLAMAAIDDESGPPSGGTRRQGSNDQSPTYLRLGCIFKMFVQSASSCCCCCMLFLPCHPCRSGNEAHFSTTTHDPI